MAFFLANWHEPTVRTKLRLRALAVEAEAGVLVVGLHPPVNVFKVSEGRLGRQCSSILTATAGLRVG